MASDTKSPKAIVEDYFSDDDNGVSIEPLTPELLLGKANVRAKRSTPEDTGPGKGPAGTVPAVDVKSDSGYSSHSVGSMNSAETTASDMSSRQCPPVIPGETGWPLSRRDSQSSRRTTTERRPIITQRQPERRDRRDVDGCTAPGCTKCGPDAIETRPHQARRQSMLTQMAKSAPGVYDTRTRISDPARYRASSPTNVRPPRMYHAQGGTVVQPAITRRTPMSSRPARPISYHGALPRIHSTHPQLPHLPPHIQHSLSQGPPPAAFYQQQQIQPLNDDQQRPPLQARASQTSAYGYPIQPPVVQIERSNRDMPSARYHTDTLPPPRAQRRPSPIDYQMDYEGYENSSDSASESELDDQPRSTRSHEFNPLKIKRQTDSVPLASSVRSYSAYDTPRARVIVEGSRLSRRHSGQIYDTSHRANGNGLNHVPEAYSGSEKEVESEENGEIRRRIGNDAPVTLSLNGDMEGRTLQLLPLADGMNELVTSNHQGHEVGYRSERRVLRGARRALQSALQAPRAAEEVSERTSNSSRRRRDVNKDTGAKHILPAREFRTIVVQDPERTASLPADSAVEQGERGSTIESVKPQKETPHTDRSKAPEDVDKHHLDADLDPLERPLIGLDPAKMRDLELRDQEIDPSIMLAAANDPWVQEVNDSLRGDNMAHRALEDTVRQTAGPVVGHLHHHANEETASILTITQEADDSQDRDEAVESPEDSHNKEIQSKSVPKTLTEGMSDTMKSAIVRRASDSPESRPLLLERQSSPDRLASWITEEIEENDHNRSGRLSKVQHMSTSPSGYQTHVWFDQPHVHSVSPLTASQATLPPGKPKLDDAELEAFTQRKPTANDRPLRPDSLLGVNDHERWVNFRPREPDDDAVSIGSSYATSVFSIASLASDATDLSRASGYSSTQIATATRELVTIFEEDSSFIVLYLIALVHPSIGPERLQRNLRRLFKVYAECLQEEAKDQLEYLASRLVLLKARHLARSIVAKYHAKVCHNDQRDESSGDEQIEERPVDENVFEDLVSFREFLVGSEAFENLHSQLKIFVSPKEPESLLVEPSAQAVILRQDKPQKTQLSGVMTSERSWQAWSGDARRVLDAFFMDPKDLVLARRALFLVIDAFYMATDGLSIRFGLLEPPLVQNATRLRWKTVSQSSFL